MTSAMDENDIYLHGIPIEVDESVAELISKQKGSDIFSKRHPQPKKRNIISIFLFNIIRSGL